jgi:anaerobic selenocysteine-containing dehydrogenase
MTNEKCYVAGKFARVALGTRHVDYNGRLCVSAAAAAYAQAFGINQSPVPMTDIPLAQCLLVVQRQALGLMADGGRSREAGRGPGEGRGATAALRRTRRPG